MDVDLLISLHENQDRQGPGSAVHTEQALRLTGCDTNKPLVIADIGCGTGAQTMTLARHLRGEVVAVDVFPAFLEKLQQRAKSMGLANKITTLQADMENLPFDEASYDILWSEGAIYNMGFENGVRQWRKYLKRGGFLAVSEIAWLTDQRPAELDAHWQKAYPEIDTLSSKIKVLEKNGYAPVAHFVLPPSCWIDHYYEPLTANFDSFLQKHKHSEAAQRIVANEKQEIALYKKYQNYYSYGFFIAKKL